MAVRSSPDADLLAWTQARSPSPPPAQGRTAGSRMLATSPLGLALAKQPSASPPLPSPPAATAHVARTPHALHAVEPAASPVPTSIHPRAILLSAAQTCLQPTRRLQLPPSVASEYGFAQAAQAAALSPGRSVFNPSRPLSQLRNRSNSRPNYYTGDSRSEVTSPATSHTGSMTSGSGSGIQSPNAMDDYQHLIGGVDPYEYDLADSGDEEGEMGDANRMDEEQSLPWFERLLVCVSRKIVRLGELLCTGLMSFAVIFALFSEPIRMGYAPRSMDSLFLVLTMGVFVLFLAEAAICWCFAYFAPTHTQHATALTPTINPTEQISPSNSDQQQTPAPATPTSDDDAAGSANEPAYSFPVASMLSYSPWLSLWCALSSSAAVSTNLSLEALLDAIAILALLPELLYVSELISLTRLQRDLLLASKAGFLVRLVGMLRWVPFDLMRVEDVCVHMCDRQWWVQVAWPSLCSCSQWLADTTRIPMHAKPLPAIKRMGQAFRPRTVVDGDATVTLSPITQTGRISGVTSPASTSSPSSRLQVTDTPSPALSPVPPSGDSPHSVAAAFAAASLLRLPSHSSTSNNSSSTPPTHPQPAMALQNRIRVNTNPAQSVANIRSLTSPASSSSVLSPSEERLVRTPDSPAFIAAAEARRPSSRTSATQSSAQGSVQPPPFSPRLPLGLVHAPHHRSPLLLHPQLSRASSGSCSGSAAGSGAGVGPTPGSCPERPAPTRLISLSAMSPMSQHRRLLSSGSGSNYVLSPMNISVPNSAAASPPISQLPSPVGVGLHAAMLPASRAISLTAMSPIVSSRTILARQHSQQHPQQHSLAAAGSPATSAATTPVAALPSSLYDSPASRVRALTHPAQPAAHSSRAIASSPMLSSRALSGMAALQHQQQQQQQHQQQLHQSSFDAPPLTPQHSSHTIQSSPPMAPSHAVASHLAPSANLSPPQMSVSRAPTGTPSSSPPTLPLLARPSSRSAGTSPHIRNRTIPIAYSPEEELANSRATSPSAVEVIDAHLAQTADEEQSMLLHQQQMQQQQRAFDEADVSPPPAASSAPSSPRSSSHLSHASHIGQLLSDYTAHRTIIGLLVIVCAWHAMHPLQLDTRPQFGLERIQHQFDQFESIWPGDFARLNETATFPSLLAITIDQYRRAWEPDLLFLRVGPVELVRNDEVIGSLRLEEISQLRTASCESWLNVRPYSQLLARFDLYTMLWLISMLPILLFVVYKDVHAVVTPIERMVSFVGSLVRDPLSKQLGGLAPAAGGPSRGGSQSDLNADSSMEDTLLMPSRSSSAESSSSGDSPTLASSFVEATLQRLVVLLQVGFGMAGSEIIASNISGDILNPMIPGSRVFAVFGFCEILDFNRCTEILEESIMSFVNQIAAIVHEQCQHFGGTVNKNIGQSFLLVWKFDAQDMKALRHVSKQRHQHIGSSGGAGTPALSNTSTRTTRPPTPLLLHDGSPALHRSPAFKGLGGPGGGSGDGGALAQVSMRRQQSARASPPDPVTEPNTTKAQPNLLGRQRSSSMRQQSSHPLPPSHPPSSHATFATMGGQMSPRNGGMAPRMDLPSSFVLPAACPLSPPRPLTEMNLQALTSNDSSMPSRPLESRRLSIVRSVSAATGTPTDDADVTDPDNPEGDLMAPPPIQRSSSESATPDESFDTLPPSASASVPRRHSRPLSLAMPTVGEGEMVTDRLRYPASFSLQPSRQLTPSTATGSLLSGSARINSNWSTPVLLSPLSTHRSSLLSSSSSSYNPSLAPSHLTSQVPSPVQNAAPASIISPPFVANVSSHASGALSRLFKLDSDLMRSSGSSPNAGELPRAAGSILSSARRMSHPLPFFLPTGASVQEEPEESDKGAEDAPKAGGKDADKEPDNEGDNEDDEADVMLLRELARKRLASTRAPGGQSQSEPTTQLATPTNKAKELFGEESEKNDVAPPSKVEPAATGEDAPSNPPSGSSHPTQSRAARAFAHPPATSKMLTRTGLRRAAAPHYPSGRPLPLKRPDTATTPSSTASSSTRHSPPTPPPLRTAIHRIANQALSAFLSTILHVSTDCSMARWRNDPLLQPRSKGQGPGQAGLGMGFGLHVGWAIEGAIGSAHKIDASYLSPHVNMASRLCGATRQYRIPFLFSGPFYKLLDPNIQKRCRHLDQVLVKGSSQPMDLYTFDICPGWKKAAAAAAMTGAAPAPTPASNTTPPASVSQRPRGLTDSSVGSSSGSGSGSGGAPTNYAKMRSDWMNQIGSINFKVPPRRRHSVPVSHAEADAAAAATAAATPIGTDAVTNGGSGSSGSSDDSSAKIKSHSPSRRGSRVATPVSAASTLQSSTPTANGTATSGQEAATGAAAAAASTSSSSDPSIPGLPRAASALGPDGPRRKGSNPDAGADAATAHLISQLNVLLGQLQCDLPDNYVSLFNQGIRHYINGDWSAAGRCLVKFQTLHREKVASSAMSAEEIAAEGGAGAAAYTVDGPSNLILQFMGQHAFQAPRGWKGYRQLTQK